jgi:hypothetical protein
MAHTHRTARKSTNRPPIGQLAPQNVPRPQESQPNVPQHASHQEESFSIEVVVPESPMAQGSHAEEQQQPKNHDIEDEADEEQPPLSDTENEKMYRDADEVESFVAEARSPPAGFRLCWNTWASPPPPCTGSRKSHVQGSWNSRSSQISSSGPESSAGIRG